jgi:formylglycine-generating enzyme required for sulfatase activity
MKPAAPGDTQPLRPAQPPLRLLRWQARTQVFYEELGNGARLTMVRIPAGSFQMGSAEQEPGRHANEGPLHTVTLAEFLIGQTPITQAQWRAVAGWQERPGERWGREMNPEPAKFQGEEARLVAGETSTEGRPVERVSWLEAMEFCSRLSQRTKRNYTLPSEAQWEYACRAGTSTAYCFGAIIYSDLANFRGTDASRFSSPTPDPQPRFREQTTPVGMFPANPWGLHDMHGNVLEWCLDSVRSSYEGGPFDGSGWEDPQAPKEQQRITRGGSWSKPPRFCRSAFRSPSRSPSKTNATEGPFDDVGFRVVCLPPGQSTAAAERPAAEDWSIGSPASRSLKSIKIFIASSSELKEDRDAIELHLLRMNEKFRRQGFVVNVLRWENFLDDMSETRLQDEYNKAIKECDVYLSLFKTQIGNFAEEEFDLAHAAFIKTGKPLISVYFFCAEVPGVESAIVDLNSLWSFQKRLSDLGHHQATYTTTEDLCLRFGSQLHILVKEGKI